MTAGQAPQQQGNKPGKEPQQQGQVRQPAEADRPQMGSQTSLTDWASI
jgi:hypothetical protein